MSREQHVYPCKTYHTSFCCRELCQEDAVLFGDKMKSLVNRKCCCLLSLLAIKACNIETSNTLSFEQAQPVEIEFHFISDTHWPNTIFHVKTNCIVAYFYQTKLSQLFDRFAFRSS